jgi:hypothetical protein
MNSGGNWKGMYGYDTKHSTYSADYKSRKTETGIGVGTGQLTYKRCGILKPDKQMDTQNDTKQCATGTCPWR